MIVREGAFAESLVDFCWRASGDRIFVSGFLRVLYNSRLEWLGFWLFLGRLRDALAARTIFQTGYFILTGVSVTYGSEGSGSCIEDFRGWVVVVFVGGRTAGELHRISTVNVSRSTTSKKDFTPYELCLLPPQMEIKSNQIFKFILVLN